MLRSHKKQRDGTETGSSLSALLETKICFRGTSEQSMDQTWVCYRLRCQNPANSLEDNPSVLAASNDSHCQLICWLFPWLVVNTINIRKMWKSVFPMAIMISSNVLFCSQAKDVQVFLINIMNKHKNVHIRSWNQRIRTKRYSICRSWWVIKLNVILWYDNFCLQIHHNKSSV